MRSSYEFRDVSCELRVDACVQSAASRNSYHYHPALLIHVAQDRRRRVGIFAHHLGEVVLQAGALLESQLGPAFAAGRARRRSRRRRRRRLRRRPDCRRAPSPSAAVAAAAAVGVCRMTFVSPAGIDFTIDRSITRLTSARPAMISEPELPLGPHQRLAHHRRRLDRRRASATGTPSPARWDRDVLGRLPREQRRRRCS